MPLPAPCTPPPPEEMVPPPPPQVPNSGPLTSWNSRTLLNPTISPHPTAAVMDMVGFLESTNSPVAPHPQRPHNRIHALCQGLRPLVAFPVLIHSAHSTRFTAGPLHWLFPCVSKLGWSSACRSAITSSKSSPLRGPHKVIPQANSISDLASLDPQLLKCVFICRLGQCQVPVCSMGLPGSCGVPSSRHTVLHTVGAQ